ncbi:MAG: proprotein convertase P-domain-containing protein, partial [Verrucomicrobia subdivision 3 bacterium]|nr:proprotein convertase P-domain-containing protein [Limisphaerales bacterium]
RAGYGSGFGPGTNYLYTVFTDNTNLTFTPIKFGTPPFTNSPCPTNATGTGDNNCNYFFPEEPLRQMRGEDALGTWRLEIWDNRVGAPTGELLSWQLEFELVNTNPPVTLLTNSQCITGIAEGGNVMRFAVRAPVVAAFATNTLTSSNGNNMILSARGTAPAIGSVPPDEDETPPAPTGILVLNTGTAPLLRPGLNYYLAVRNEDPTQTNAFTLCVAFDQENTNNLSTIVGLTNGQCITTNIAATNLLTYYQFDASSNAVQVIFELTGLGGNLDMVIRRGLPLPTPQSFFQRGAQPGTTDEVLAPEFMVTTIPGRWYIGVYNLTSEPVTYTFCAREIPGVQYVDLTPYACTTNSVTVPPQETHYYSYTMGPNVRRAFFLATNLTGNGDMYITAGPIYPPPSTTNFVAAGTRPGTTPELIVLSGASSPPLVPATTYYIAMTNVTAAPVTYELCILAFGSRALANGVCLTNTFDQPDDSHFYTFTIASNSMRADFLTLDATGDVDLYLSQFPIPGPINFDYSSEQPATGNEVITVTATNQPVPLAPGNWHVAVVLRDAPPVTYCIKAMQYALDPVAIRLFITNGLPSHVTWDGRHSTS